MSIDTQHMDPRCKVCETKDCQNCALYGTRFLLTDPPIPPGKSVKRIRTPGGLVQYVFEEPQKTSRGEIPCGHVKSSPPLDKSSAADYNNK